MATLDITDCFLVTRPMAHRYWLDRSKRHAFDKKLKEKELTQEDLAKLVPCDVSTLKRAINWLQKDRGVSEQTFTRIMSALKIPDWKNYIDPQCLEERHVNDNIAQEPNMSSLDEASKQKSDSSLEQEFGEISALYRSPQNSTCCNYSTLTVEGVLKQENLRRIKAWYTHLTDSLNATITIVDDYLILEVRFEQKNRCHVKAQGQKLCGLLENGHLIIDDC